MLRSRRLISFAFLTALMAAPAAYPQSQITGPGGISHVLLISIDGMHALDFVNCANGIAGVNNGAPYCPYMGALATTGVSYLNASTSKPSDSFPGLMALMTGGSPRTVGAFYDVAYDRSLNPPAVTTGNGLAGGPCTPGLVPPGTTTDAWQRTCAEVGATAKRLADDFVKQALALVGLDPSAAGVK